MGGLEPKYNEYSGMAHSLCSGVRSDMQWAWSLYLNSLVVCLFVCFLLFVWPFFGNVCLETCVPKFVSSFLHHSNKPLFCIGKQTLPLQRFLVSLFASTNLAAKRLFPWAKTMVSSFNTLVFFPANTRFSSG